MSLVRKSCSYLLLLPDEETLAQGLTMGSTSAADHLMAWRTLEHPQESSDAEQCDSSGAQERWDTEFVLSIKGTPWSPDGERAGDVNIRVDLPEARGDRGRGLVSPPKASFAVPFEQELGIGQTTPSDVAKRIEQELETEPQGASRVARDRENLASQARGASQRHES